MKSTVLRLYEHYKTIGYTTAMQDLLSKYPDLEAPKEVKEEAPKKEKSKKSE